MSMSRKVMIATVVLSALGLWRVGYSTRYYEAHPKVLQKEIARCEKTQDLTANCKAAAAAQNNRLLNPKNNQVPSI